MKPTLKIAWILLFISIGFYAHSQNIRQLQVGDTIPPIIIRNLWKQQGQTAALSEFRKNQFMIINFWATWCSPCVRELKMLVDFSKNNKKLKVLSVSYEDEKTVGAFLKIHHDIANSDLQIVTDDTILKKFFYYQTLPHNIWVDRRGVIVAITGSDEMNKEELEKFINNEPLQVKTKIDAVFDWTKPMHIPDSLIQFRSIFNSHLTNVHSGGALIDVNGLGFPHMKLFYCYNLGIIDLLYSAYLLPGFLPNEYLYEINTRDSSKYFYNKHDKNYKYLTDWEEKHTFAYEFRTSKPLDDSIFSSHVINDLDLNLQLKSSLEYRKRFCCIVTCTKKLDSIGFIGNKNPRYLNIEGDKLVLRNISIDFLLNWLVKKTYKSPRSEESFRKEPYVNQTGINYTISTSIALGNDPDKYTQHEYLEKYITQSLGMRFITKEQPYKVLVIRDK